MKRREEDKDPFGVICTMVHSGKHCNLLRPAVWTGKQVVRACPRCDMIGHWPRWPAR